MILIDLHTYEAFLLDYSEGNLSAEAVSSLKAFLLAHPELELDLNDFDLPHLSSEHHTADFKNALKRTEAEVPDAALLNYLEGNLSPEQKISFEVKLAADKSLAKHLEDYRKTILVADSKEVAGFKPVLHKTEEDLIVNNRLIAYLENQLTALERTQLKKELASDTALQQEYQLVSKTILAADLAVVYPEKNALKKEGRVIPLSGLRTAGSVAAAVLLLFGLAFLYNHSSSNKKGKNDLAKHTSVPKTDKKIISTPATALAARQNRPVGTHEVRTPAAPEKTRTFTPERKKEIPAIVQQQELREEQENNRPEIAEAKEPEDKKMPAAGEQKTEVASVSLKPESNEDSVLSKQNYLVLAEEIDAANDLIANAPVQKGFWKRAVQLARQANKLGVKSVDGQENSVNSYRLSFNAFSVGKK